MKFVVIGGGAAGMSAVSKAKRLDRNIEATVVEGGSYVSYAQCGIPYYIEGLVRDSSELIHYPITEFTEKRGIKIVTGKRVRKIDRTLKEIELSDGSRLAYDKLLIATGVHPKVPVEFANSGAFAIRSLESGIEVHDRISTARTVTVIGDGVLGMELADSLQKRGLKVRIVSKHSRPLQALDNDIGGDFLSEISSKFNFEFNSSLKGIEKLDHSYRITTEKGTHESDVVIFATGVLPNSEIASQAGIEVSKGGFIRTDKFLRTSDPDIFAAGDVAECTNVVTGKPGNFPLAQISNKMGRVAGATVAGAVTEFPGSLGTTLLKILDYEIGYTGLNEKQASMDGIAWSSTYIKAPSRARYYPGGSEVLMKIVYEKGSDRIIGAQVISKDGGAWRLNVLATAIQARFTLDDLFFDDIGYSPPFDPVWDPIIVAASVAKRI
ncbi:MAG: FAD-dependent oxidoreductase [Thermoplasmataceae archaeon]